MLFDGAEARKHEMRLKSIRSILGGMQFDEEDGNAATIVLGKMSKQGIGTLIENRNKLLDGEELAVLNKAIDRAEEANRRWTSK